MSSSVRAVIVACLGTPLLLGLGRSLSAQDQKKVEPASAKEPIVRCEIAGRASFLALKPNFAIVVKGETVCELDPAALEDQLGNQEIGISRAQAALENAKLTREVAELAVTEYLEGTFKQQVGALSGEIALAQTSSKRADERLEWTQRMIDKGYLINVSLPAARLNAQTAKYALEQAQTKKVVLEKYTKEKTTKVLKSQVEKGRADEQARDDALRLEQAKAEKLRRQIESCKIVAPVSGRVVYAREFVSGDVVVEGQAIFKMIPDDEAKPAGRSGAKALGASPSDGRGR